MQRVVQLSSQVLSDIVLLAVNALKTSFSRGQPLFHNACTGVCCRLYVRVGWLPAEMGIVAKPVYVHACVHGWMGVYLQVSLLLHFIVFYFFFHNTKAEQLYLTCGETTLPQGPNNFQHVNANNFMNLLISQQCYRAWTPLTQAHTDNRGQNLNKWK